MSLDILDGHIRELDAIVNLDKLRGIAVLS